MLALKKIIAVFCALTPFFAHAENVIRINVPIRVANEAPAPSPVRDTYTGRFFFYTTDQVTWNGPRFSFDYDGATETLTIKTMPGVSTVTLSDGRVVTSSNQGIHLNKTDNVSVVSVYLNARPDLADTVYCLRPIGDETYADIKGTCNKISSMNFKL